MWRRAVFIAALAAQCLIWGQQAQEPELTLDQAVALAIEQNRPLKVAQLEVAKSADAVAAARTYRLPVFQFNAIGAQLLTPLNFRFPAGSLGSIPGLGAFPIVDSKVTTPRRPIALLQASASQPLSQLHKISLGIRLQDLNRQVAQEKLTAQQLVTVNDVKKTYYGLLQAQSAMEAVAEALGLLAELERVVESGLSQQVVLRADLLEVQTKRARMEQQKIVLQNGIATLKEKLNNLMGRDLRTPFRVATLPAATDWTVEVEAARQRALDQRPEIREARLKSQQAQLDRKLKRAEYLPEVSASLMYLTPANTEFLPRNVAAAGVVVNWDVFDWGRKKHELAAKDKTIAQSKLGVTETESQILVEVDARFRKLEETRAQLRVSDLARQTAAERVRLATTRLAQQTVLPKDALQAQTALAEASTEYQQSLLAFWTARADLEKATGDR
jgi:outer membrane protein TolC